MHTNAGVAGLLALSYFPFVVLLVIAGLRGIDPRLEEAARLRTGQGGIWLGVTLPLVRPHLVAGWLFVLVLSMVELATADILRVQTYPLEIFIQFSALYDEAAALALSMPVLLVTFGAIALLTLSMGERGYVSLSGGSQGHRRVGLAPWRWLSVGVCAIPILLSVLVPVMSLAMTAGPASVYLEAVRRSGDEILISTALAVLAALFTLILATGLALSLRALTSPVRSILTYLVQIPFGVPPVLLAIGLILLWNRPETQWIYGSAAILVMGYVAHFVPFALRAVDAALAQIPPNQIAAAQLAGGPWKTLGLLLDALRQGLLAAAFIVFVLALGELGMTLLITPPGLTPIPIGIYNLMHYGADDAVAARCLILVGIQLCVAGVLLVPANPGRSVR